MVPVVAVILFMRRTTKHRQEIGMAISEVSSSARLAAGNALAATRLAASL